MAQLRISNCTLRRITHWETRYFPASLRTFELLVHHPSPVEAAIAIIEVLRKKKRLIIDRYAPSPHPPNPMIATAEETLAHLRTIRWRNFMALVNEHPRARTRLHDPNRSSLWRRRLTEKGWKKLASADLTRLDLTPRQRQIAQTIIKHRSVRKACDELKLSSYWVGTIWSSVRPFGLEWPDDEPFDPPPVVPRQEPLRLRIKEERPIVVVGLDQDFKAVVTENGQIALLEEDDAGDLLLVGPYTPPPLPPAPSGTETYDCEKAKRWSAEEAELREIEAAAERWWRFREWVNTHPARRANI